VTSVIFGHINRSCYLLTYLLTYLLFTRHSFAITERDSFWPRWAHIAAREAQARAGGAEPPRPPLTLTGGQADSTSFRRPRPGGGLRASGDSGSGSGGGPLRRRSAM